MTFAIAASILGPIKHLPLADMYYVAAGWTSPAEDGGCVLETLPLLWSPEQDRVRTVHSTKLGKVYQADCQEFLGGLKTASVHTIFADPPFNLKKHYGNNGNGDDLPAAKYLAWSKQWISESVRVLAPGGALFIYNLPKWLIEYGCYLNSMAEMSFKHWIAVDKAHSLPIPNRLSPSHYGMLY